MRETGNYIFELRHEPNGSQADLLIDEIPLVALRATDPTTSIWRWSPGFHVGVVEAELRLPGTGYRRFEIITDPDRRKLTRDEFDCMVREILEDTFALFSLTGFRKSVARGTGNRAPPIARLEFLRSRVEEVETICRTIARRPRHRLTADEDVVPYYRAVRATGQEVQRSFRSGRVLSDNSGSKRLPAALKGFLPDKIKQRRKRSSLDLAEHRQMTACLRVWQTWLMNTAELLEHTSRSDNTNLENVNDVWVPRCRRLANRLGQIRRLPPFVEAGEAIPSLVLSPVFRNDPDYRRFYQIWRDMNLGISAVFGNFLGMPLARTFDLYELWCFLRLLRAAADHYGPGNFDANGLFIGDFDGSLNVAAHAAEIAVGPGWKICFKRQYREFWRDPEQRGSFSRTMQPDLTIGTKPEADSQHLIVLDAKYRIEEGLNDALNSIHTYRDALVHRADNGSSGRHRYSSIPACAVLAGVQ